MDILLAENLKRLRAERGGPQDALASHLGVTSQAVSKWERGESFPDITLLPAIAAYYDASVDELLGVGEIHKKEKIAAYMEQDFQLMSEGRMAEKLALWEAAYKEFPRELSVMTQLAYALQMNAQTAGDYAYSDRIIALCKEILERAAGETYQYRFSAIQVLVSLYNALGDGDKAKEYAQMSCHILVTTPQLLMIALNGDEAIAQAQQNLLVYLDCIFTGICHTGSRDDRWKIKIWRTALKIFDTVFEDGDYGFYNVRTEALCASIAGAHARLGEFEEAFTYLERSAKDSIAFETYGDFKRTSPLVDTTEDIVGARTGNRLVTEIEARIESLETYEPYAPMRSDPRFVSILERLKNAAPGAERKRADV
ncbi:MAG: helix-turn-helix domain-containing protein [Oscillospiraceae bacterium]|jgi:transcriptional regulator with XRE-family HTH domain|nr:helix-turn-helix domain-containing protein [Oscillospiraceae bacterium]